MEALATPGQLADRLPSSVVIGDHAAGLLLDASSAVRARTRQQFTVGTSTIVRAVTGAVIRLPQRPVTAVSSVIGWETRTALDYLWLPGSDSLTLTSPLDAGVAVEIVYTHGYAVTPDDVVAVVCQMVGRALGTPSTESGTQQESVAGYSHTTGAAAASGPVGMLPAEWDTIKHYKRATGTLRLT